MRNIEESKKYYTHITSKHNWYDLKLREVWQYRDLIWLFTKRNFTVLYKQTILGPAWIFLNPLISSVIYAFVFGGIAGIGTDGIPSILFYLAGNAVWNYFANCLNKNANAFTANANVFGKVYFPRLTIPISNVFSAMIEFGVQMILVLIFLAYYILNDVVTPRWEFWILIPIILIHLGLLGLGCGIIVSSLTTKYRDLAVVVTFGMQLWMYITPIVYPLSQLGDGIMRYILSINPVTAPVETFRYIVLGQGSIMTEYLFFSVVLTVIVMVVGIMIFNKVEKTFMDTV